MQIKLEQTTNEGCWGSFFLGSSSYLAGRATAWREYRAFASFSLSFTTTTGIPPMRWMETEGDETGRASGREGTRATRNWINQLVSMHDLYNNRSISFRRPAGQSQSPLDVVPSGNETTTTAERRHDFFFPLARGCVLGIAFARLPIVRRRGGSLHKIR